MELRVLVLQVGYISPDLFTHSVSYFAEAPLSHHQPDQVQLFVYNVTPKVRKALWRARSGRGAWCGHPWVPGQGPTTKHRFVCSWPPV